MDFKGFLSKSILISTSFNDIRILLLVIDGKSTFKMS